MRETLTRAHRGLVWYLKQATGEAKWDEYVEQCRRDGVPPMSRRDFERHRTHLREHDPRAQARCC